MLSFDDEPQKNGKTIRWCQVDVGTQHRGAGPRGIVCGAHNFAAGDLVVVALPGAMLPGGFAIAARKTYGHVSDGMICSTRELGIGDDHTGILVLPTDSAKPGDDPLELLGMNDAILDVAVTTDRGYCLSIRGLAREAAAALDVPFRDVRRPTCPRRRPRVQGAHRRPVRLRPLLGPRRHRLEPGRSDAGLDGAPAAAVRHAARSRYRSTSRTT